jgi:hypothetical protein
MDVGCMRGYMTKTSLMLAVAIMMTVAKAQAYYDLDGGGSGDRSPTIQYHNIENKLKVITGEDVMRLSSIQLHEQLLKEALFSPCKVVYYGILEADPVFTKKFREAGDRQKRELNESASTMINWLEKSKVEIPSNINMNVDLAQAAQSISRAIGMNAGIVNKVQVLREFMEKLAARHCGGPRSSRL